MKEITLRKYHRTIGIILAFFIFLQIGSGVALILDYWIGKLLEKNQVSSSSGTKEELESSFVKVMDFIHFKGGGVAGGIYRVIIGVGMMGLVISGSMVFFMIQTRRHVK